MRRPIVIAAGLLVAALIVAGGVVALSPAEPAGSAYTVTVAEVTAGLRQHPKQWVSRTVAVRGVAMGLNLSVGGGGSSPSLSWGDGLARSGPPRRPAPSIRAAVLALARGGDGREASELRIQGHNPPYFALPDYTAHHVIVAIARFRNLISNTCCHFSRKIFLPSGLCSEF